MKNYKPWLMILIISEFLFFMMPGINSTGNLFVLPVSEELGLTRSAYSFSFTITCMTMAICSFYYGKLYKKLGAKYILLLISIFAIISCVISANANTLFMVYLGAFFRGLVMALGSTSIAATIVSNWFDKYRGIVNGLVFSAIGFGGMFLLPVYSKWVLSIGWRTTYYYIGIIVGISSLLAALLIKSTPEEAGAIPFGSVKKEDHNDQCGKQKIDTGIPLSSAIKTRVFYISIIIILLINITFFSAYTHLVAFLTMKNVSGEFIGILLGIANLAIGGAKLIYGWICDRFGVRSTMLIASVIMIAFASILLYSISQNFLLIGCIILGFGMGSMVLSVTFLAGLFGNQDYPTIVGIFSGVLGFAWGIGAWVTGIFHDIFGSYSQIFTIFIIFGLITWILSFMIPKESSLEQNLLENGSVCSVE